MMDALDIPIELNIPLPASRTGSEDEEDQEGLSPKNSQTGEAAPLINEVQGNQQIITNFTEELKDEDVSQDWPTALGIEIPAMNLDELAQLIQLERYHSGLTLSDQETLSRAMLSYGLNRRLIRSMALAYTSMVNSFEADNQARFARIFEVCQQLVESCGRYERSMPTATRYWTGEYTYTPHQGGPSYSWLHNLPSTQQRDILRFLTKIRTDPDFLSDRICHLSSADLLALISPCRSATVVESVLHNQSHGKAQDFVKNHRPETESSSLDALKGFHRQDPMFALLYDIFDDSSKPGSSEYGRRIDIWSTTCARTTALGKRGSDEFLTATLNSFAGLQEWPLKSKLELFLTRILQEGAFLLDPPANEVMDFRQPLEIRKASAVIAGSNFFDQAIKDVFVILTQGSARDSIPGAVLDFARAFLNKIQDPSIRLRAKNFVAAKWYFSSFLPNILVHPEVSRVSY